MKAAIRAGFATAAVNAWLILASIAHAATPTPGTEAGDPRSSGQGPGLVGDPQVSVGLGPPTSKYAWQAGV